MVYVRTYGTVAPSQVPPSPQTQADEEISYLLPRDDGYPSVNQAPFYQSEVLYPHLQPSLNHTETVEDQIINADAKKQKKCRSKKRCKEVFKCCLIVAIAFAAAMLGFGVARFVFIRTCSTAHIHQYPVPEIFHQGTVSVGQAVSKINDKLFPQTGFFVEAGKAKSIKADIHDGAVIDIGRAEQKPYALAASINSGLLELTIFKYTDGTASTPRQVSVTYSYGGPKRVIAITAESSTTYSVFFVTDKDALMTVKVTISAGLSNDYFINSVGSAKYLATARSPQATFQVAGIQGKQFVVVQDYTTGGVRKLEIGLYDEYSLPKFSTLEISEKVGVSLVSADSKVYLQAGANLYEISQSLTRTAVKNFVHPGCAPEYITRVASFQNGILAYCVANDGTFVANYGVITKGEYQVIAARNFDLKLDTSLPFNFVPHSSIGGVLIYYDYTKRVRATVLQAEPTSGVFYHLEQRTHKTNELEFTAGCSLTYISSNETDGSLILGCQNNAASTSKMLKFIVAPFKPHGVVVRIEKMKEKADEIIVARKGLITIPYKQFTPNKPIYATNYGEITQDLNSAFSLNYHSFLGTAVTATQVQLNIK